MENFPDKTLEKKLQFSFRKEERLCSKKIIDKLFTEGNSFVVFPLKINYLATKVPSVYPVQAAFTVSKKAFKKAVQRNFIKRKMREAYRLNKHLLYNKLKEGEQLGVFFIFIGKEIKDCEMIEQALLKGFKKLVKKTQKESGHDDKCG